MPRYCISASAQTSITITTDRNTIASNRRHRPSPAQAAIARPRQQRQQAEQQQVPGMIEGEHDGVSRRWVC